MSCKIKLGREQGAGSREQGAGSKEQEKRENREKEAGKRKQGDGSREKKKELSREQVSGNKQKSSQNIWELGPVCELLGNDESLYLTAALTNNLREEKSVFNRPGVAVVQIASSLINLFIHSFTHPL